MENISLVGLSRQVALRRELDVIANNLANLNTTGFKGDAVVFEEFISPTANDQTFQRGADRRLSFVWDRATATNLGQGPLEQTGNGLDVGIGGRGYFVVRTPEGERYTRNGSFEINAQGQLVTKQGYPVLGDTGPITFDQADTGITITRDGTISVIGNNATNQPAGLRGRLRLVEGNTPRALEKAGDNLFQLRAGAQVANLTPANVDLRQGYIEKSNVTPVVEMSRMIEVTRAYTALSASIERHDQLRRDAIRSLGNPAS